MRNYLKSPPTYHSKPYHPFPLSSSSSSRFNLKYLQLYLLILCLLIAFAHQILISSESDPLLKGRTPVHRFTSLHSAVLLFLFLLLSDSTSLLPLPHDLFFALASALFFLQYYSSSSSASLQTSDLQAKIEDLAFDASGGAGCTGVDGEGLEWIRARVWLSGLVASWVDRGSSGPVARTENRDLGSRCGSRSWVVAGPCSGGLDWRRLSRWFWAAQRAAMSGLLEDEDVEE